MIVFVTDKIRAIPYFSDFQEESVEVFDKPFLQELLDESLNLPSLSAEELTSCLETCIYFSLKSKDIAEELLWKLGEEEKLFRRWFEADGELSEDWRLRPELPVVIKMELIQAAGAVFTNKRLIQLGIRCLKASCADIAEGGNLRLLKWAHENDYPWDAETCNSAAKNGHLECLKYAHEKGCPWNGDACFVAALRGKLDCLKYLYEQGCSFRRGNWYGLSCACYAAASEGHLDCFKYAHENGCPWDHSIPEITRLKDHLDCLQYALENAPRQTYAVGPTGSIGITGSTGAIGPLASTGALNYPIVGPTGFQGLAGPAGSSGYP